MFLTFLFLLPFSPYRIYYVTVSTLFPHSLRCRILSAAIENAKEYFIIKEEIILWLT